MTLKYIQTQHTKSEISIYYQSMIDIKIVLYTMVLYKKLA